MADGDFDYTGSDRGPGGSSGDIEAAAAGAGPAGPGLGGPDFSSEFSGLDMMFSPARDSQFANEVLGLGPMSEYTGGVNIGGQDYEQSSGFDWDNVLGFFDRITRNPVAQALAAKAGLAPLVGIYNLARSSQTPQGAARAWGGLGGSQIGQAAFGPAGGIVGGMLGQYAGSKSGGLPGYTGTRESNAPEGAPGMDLGTLAGGLAGIYSANRDARQAGQMAGTLGDLYGQNSPFAQALRQQLERKDAAAGRRSQYGPREVELQARLAGLYSQNAPHQLNAQRAQQEAKNQRLFTLLGLGKRMGAFDWASRGLRDIFSTPTDMTGFQTPYEMPSYSDYAAETYTPTNFGEFGTGTYGGNDFFLNY